MVRYKKYVYKTFEIDQLHTSTCTCTCTVASSKLLHNCHVDLHVHVPRSTVTFTNVFCSTTDKFTVWHFTDAVKQFVTVL